MNEKSLKRVYLACPMTEYHKDIYEMMVVFVKEKYPKHNYLFVRELYSDNRDFKKRFRDEVSSCSDFVFFTDSYDCIGWGVYEELETFKGAGGTPLLIERKSIPYRITNSFTLYKTNLSLTRYALVVSREGCVSYA